MTPFEVRRITDQLDMDAALGIRRAVFVEEQGVDQAIEIDEYDTPSGNAAVHMLALLNGRAVATGRLLLAVDARGLRHIGRVAVLQAYRGSGAGRAVMLALQDEARRLGGEQVTLAAQLHAIGFYEGLGYVAHGDVFLDAGIEHRQMDLRL